MLLNRCPIQLLLFLLLFFGAPTLRVEAKSISPGQTIKDNWDVGETVRQYDFDGTAGQYMYVLFLEKSDEDLFEPAVEVVAPDDSSVSDQDKEMAFLRCVRLPETGEYELYIGGIYCRLCQAKFVLSLILTNTPNDGGDIVYGQTIAADINPDGDMDGYRFYGRSGDAVTIQVTGSLDSRVDLVGPNGLVASASGSNAVISRTLSESGNYTIVIWGDDGDGGTYTLSLTGPGVPTPTPSPTPPPQPTPTPLPLPELRISQADVAPVAPTRLQPGDPITFGCTIENPGQPAGPFWLEFWGSRTGGLTLDAFIADSQAVGGLDVWGAYTFNTPRSLYALPDGPYTVVMVADRPNQVGEYDEGNNRRVIAGKRILTLRPQTQVDLAVDNFCVQPNPPLPGSVATFSGYVRNLGTQNSGPFWIEFWQTSGAGLPYPDLRRMICDSIYIGDLAPGGQINLGAYPRAIYPNISTTAPTGIFVDRLDTVNETDETNNYQFPSFETAAQMPAIDITLADFSPAAPTELQPGSLVSFDVDFINRGTTATDLFWVEFWGSRTGGITLDTFLCDSVQIGPLAAGASFHLDLDRPLYAVSDGPYTVVVTANRPAGGLYGRRAATGKRLLMIRPQSLANVQVLGFALGATKVIARGQTVPLAGVVINAGSQPTGPFWIEFWASRDQQYPTLERFVCDSIPVSNLAPGQYIG
ncbi:MAG: hypothetical protein N3D11_13615, partial [Candidatus Sumerlaeia bacterium]|nr:hypothetical protein [Candidatus Sumerlaeia bacterium]